MKPKVAFICTGNSCRSQMAEGFARKYGKELMEVYSAGTIPVEMVNPNAVKVMKEIGIDLTEHYPKILQNIPKDIDIAITMGCIEGCPIVNAKIKEDWGLDDPAGKDIEEFRNTRNTIEEKVKKLVEQVINSN